MPGLIDNLLDVLNQQAENYEDMLALSYEKKDVIIANDIAALQKITSIENALVGKGQKLDKNRASIMMDVKAVLGVNDDLTLSGLQELLKGKASEPEIGKARDRILTAVTSLKDINERNMALVDKALEYVDFSINVLRSSVGDSPDFGSMGAAGGQDTRNLFDARQ